MNSHHGVNSNPPESDLEKRLRLAAASRLYYAANKEAISKQRKLLYQKNREERLARLKAIRRRIVLEEKLREILFYIRDDNPNDLEGAIAQILTAIKDAGYIEP